MMLKTKNNKMRHNFCKMLLLGFLASFGWANFAYPATLGNSSENSSERLMDLENLPPLPLPGFLVARNELDVSKSLPSQPIITQPAKEAKESQGSKESNANSVQQPPASANIANIPKPTSEQLFLPTIVEAQKAEKTPAASPTPLIPNPSPSPKLSELPPLPKITMSQDDILIKTLAAASKSENQTQAQVEGFQAPQDLYSPTSVDDPSFINMLRQKFPLSPDQIKALRLIVDKQYRAIRSPIETPKPALTSRWVNLEPGSTPPVLRISSRYVSSLVFVDETGAPWPIKLYVNGNPKAFDVEYDHNNILSIKNMLQDEDGNIMVELVGLNTPINITITSDQKQVDYRLDLRIPGRGPNAAPEIIGDTVAAGPNEVLANLLEGVAPQGAEALQVNGGNAQAWINKGSLLLRTKLIVLSPSWTQYMRSVDGTQVYQLSKVPVVLASDNGKTIKLTIEGF